MTQHHEQNELLLRLLDENVSEQEREVAEQLLRSDPAAREFLRMVAEHAVVAADFEGVRSLGGEAAERESSAHSNSVVGESSRDAIGTIFNPLAVTDASPPSSISFSLGDSSNDATNRSLWALTAVAITLTLIVILGLASWRSASTQGIATITGIGGPIIWTGDGGVVTREVAVGTNLRGGTIETVTPDSWVEVEFSDGTTLTLAGTTLVTFSDHGQKEIHLRKGNVSANVSPQPTGFPLLVHTDSAVLEVLGTQFQVESELASTALNVSEGKVRVRRRSDGSTVDVPANHRVIAAADRDLALTLAPNSVSHWESTLHLGPARAHGKWVPKSKDSEAKLLSVPYTLTTRRGRTLTLYNTAFQVSSGDGPRVLLAADSLLQVHGRLQHPQRIHVGITVHQINGDFAGNFETYLPPEDFVAGESFELNLNPSKFQLDPSLIDMRDQLPDGPNGLVVSSVWVHSLNRPSGLEISKIELLPPTSPSHRD